MRSIDQLLWFRNWLIRMRRPVMRRLVGVDIPESASVSFSARFRPGRHGPITIGEQTLIAFKTLILGHDPATGREAPVRIGARCFIGGGSIVMPGVTIGDGSIIGAASVVTADVPPRSIAAGNPARVIRSGIEAGPKGRLPGADATAIAAKRALRARLAGKESAR